MPGALELYAEHDSAQDGIRRRDRDAGVDCRAILLEIRPIDEMRNIHTRSTFAFVVGRSRHDGRFARRRRFKQRAQGRRGSDPR